MNDSTYLTSDIEEHDRRAREDREKKTDVTVDEHQH
jgi:hypothetical protein